MASEACGSNGARASENRLSRRACAGAREERQSARIHARSGGSENWSGSLGMSASCCQCVVRGASIDFRPAIVAR